MPAQRITDADLNSTANNLTRATRELGIIGPLERFTLDGAYGGVKLAVTGDFEMLQQTYGTDRDAWPDGWSGHSTGTAGVLPYFATKRETWERAQGALQALYAVLNAQRDAGNA